MQEKSTWTPYATAMIAVGLVVLLAWVNKDRLKPVIPGRDAPDFSVVDLQGSPRTLADFDDKVLLVSIWATWCGPCQEEMPSMQRLYEAVGNDGFEIVAISVDAPFGEADAFGRAGGDLEAYVENLGLTFTVLHDPSGRIQRTYQTTGVPESFVIDRDGVIFKKVAGATAWDAPQNVDLIKRLLGE